MDIQEIRIEIEATTANEAAQELCGYRLTPSAPSHRLIMCDMEHIEAIAADMRERGWVGDPILITNDGGDQPRIINGRHRSVAACLAGVPIRAVEIDWIELCQLEDDGVDGDEIYDLVMERLHG